MKTCSPAAAVFLPNTGLGKKLSKALNFELCKFLEFQMHGVDYLQRIISRVRENFIRNVKLIFTKQKISKRVCTV